MHVLSPDGDFIFASDSAKELTGYSPDDLFTRSIFDFIHADDVTAFKRDFETSCRTGDTLTLYYRFKTADERHVLFEVTGHPYYEGGKPQQTPDQPAKCFFATARPYPSKNQALLDSFLELKFENERLRQELLVMYKEVEGDGSAGGEFLSLRIMCTLGSMLTKITPVATAFPYGQPGMYRADSFDPSSRSVIDPSTGLVQTQALIPSTSNTYGALGIGISANGTKGDGTGEKKKKASLRSLVCAVIGYQCLMVVANRRCGWRRANLFAVTGECSPVAMEPRRTPADLPSLLQWYGRVT